MGLAASIDGNFAARWERMARASFAAFGRLLELPGEPVKVQPRYLLSDMEPGAALAKRYREDPIGFVHLEHRLTDLMPPTEDLPPGTHAFAGMHSRRSLLFRFDIKAYSQHLLTEFRQRGGVIRAAEFREPAELARLGEKVLVNCTGYGARALFQDASLIPVRGQIGWLPAQEDVRYSLQWESLNMVSRPDGIVVQLGGGGDSAGWNDTSEEPDPSEAEEAVRLLARLQMRAGFQAAPDQG